jgi:Protein of unknown function (DUF2852)
MPLLPLLLMPLLFLGFVFGVLFWLFWAMIWAAALLFWPVTLLITGVILWRATVRRSQRVYGARAEAPLAPRSQHNSAFEEYRQETMARLNEEQRNFREFLQRLRRSRDKQEFDAFMAGRRGRPALPQGDAPAA